MDNQKISFNKRISLVKKEVFENLKETKELDNIKGTNKVGFYSLSTIEKYLFPALDRYDLDLDLEIFKENIVGHWYDCIGDNIRHIEVDFKRIENVEKLQLMANIVQSEGAVKSYTRRYALTAILRLPSTDLIDNPNNNNNTVNYQSDKDVMRNYQSDQADKKISSARLKRYFAIAKNKEFDVNYLDDLIKVAYNLSSKNDWLEKDYIAFTNYMEGHTMNDTLNTLISKIKKAGKKVPEKKKLQTN